MISDSAPLSAVGERRLIAELLAPRYADVESFGDDCASLSLPTESGEIVLTTDPCPYPVVAALGEADLYHWGWLLATINFSDLAAAGATPLGLVASYVLPSDLTVGQFRDLLDGVDACAAAQHTRVIGGNLKDGKELSLTATAAGWCRHGKRMSRRGASIGDALVLLGEAGILWAFALVSRGLASADHDTRERLRRRSLEPRAKTATAALLARASVVSGAIDISDGLYAAVSELCRANGCGAIVDADAVGLAPDAARVAASADVSAFELAALWGDWNLLLSVRTDRLSECLAISEEAGERAQVIGEIAPDNDLYVRSSGREEVWRGSEFERFTQNSWSGNLLSSVLAHLSQGRRAEDDLL